MHATLKSSFVAQAVADGPCTISQPSFEAMEWLVVINLAVMTIATLACVIVVVKLAGDRWKHRRQDVWLLPSWIYRTRGILFACGITIRRAEVERSGT